MTNYEIKCYLKLTKEKRKNIDIRNVIEVFETTTHLTMIFSKKSGKKNEGFLSNVEKKHFVWSHLEKDVMYIILKTKCVI